MVHIAQPVLDELWAHANEDREREVCGFIHALDGRLTVHRVRNAAADGAGKWRYLMDSQEQYAVEKERERSGAQVFAIYHSHVQSVAQPSETDVRMAIWELPEPIGRAAVYPDAYYIVVSLTHEPRIRAWRIPLDGVPVEEPIEVA
ncbi:MAG: M67 family peptidase [Dehalococcoidia bacterium]|nr:M67 family peptidase [Dehalococcoidia bacterium]